MTDNHKKTFIYILLLTLIGFALFWSFSPVLYKLSPRDLAYDRSEIKELAIAAAEKWGYNPDGAKIVVSFKPDKNLLKYIEKNVPLEESIQAIQKSNAYYWYISWDFKKSESKDTLNRQGLLKDIENITLLLNTNGEDFAFWIRGLDKVSQTNIPEERARVLVDSVVKQKLGEKASSLKLEQADSATKNKITTYSFEYGCPSEIAGLDCKLKVDIIGDRIEGFEYKVKPPEEQGMLFSEYLGLAGFLLMVIALIIIYISILIKKLRADEINFRVALPPTILMAVSFAFIILIETIQTSFFNLAMAITFGTLFMSLPFWLAVSCADSIVRDVWDDKLLTLDALYKRKIRHRLFGLSVIRGLAIGIALLGSTTVIMKLASVLGKLSLSTWNSEFGSLYIMNPFLAGILVNINAVLWPQFGVLLLLVPLFARYFNRHIWIVAAVAAIWGICLQGIFRFPDEPYWATVATGMLLGGTFAYVFMQFDFLTSFFAHFSFIMVSRVFQLILLEHPSYSVPGYLILLLLAASALFAVMVLNRPVSKEELRKFLPGHATVIIERERLKRELEIARRIQLSFLPRTTPVIHGLDIASTCIPASEVGGDYYDFVNLGDGRFGVIIGDVSSKGISAAFYMTLTKGFLQSLTRTNLSPREIMIELNSLFYDNVPRGHFISLIYAIMDLNQRKFTFARAGHNPIFTHRKTFGKAELLCPAGIALGLTKGDIFGRVIEQSVIPIESGDIFILYTDGFTEAMNGSNEEFGENRIIDLINNGADIGAEEMMKEIQTKVTDFVGRTPQHDDMTMVILRIN